MLQTLNAKLGDLLRLELVGFQVRTGGGTFYFLQYKVIYSNYEATEMFNLVRDDATGEMRILGHNINSIGFLKE